MLFSCRLHGIELLDIPRCPSAIRDGVTDYLQFIIRTGNAYGPIVPILATALADRDERAIVDLCSGGGGPWPELRSALVSNGAPTNLRVQLTDRFPNRVAFAKNTVRDALVTGVSSPLNIEQEVVRYPGMRTFFRRFIILRLRSQNGFCAMHCVRVSRFLLPRRRSAVLWLSCSCCSRRYLSGWQRRNSAHLRGRVCFSLTSFRPFHSWCALMGLSLACEPIHQQNFVSSLRA